MLYDMNFLDHETRRTSSATKYSGGSSTSDDSGGCSTKSCLGDITAALPATRPENVAASNMEELQLSEEERILMLDMNFLDQEMDRKSLASKSRSKPTSKDGTIHDSALGATEATLPVSEKIVHRVDQGDIVETRQIKPNVFVSSYNDLQLGEEERFMMLEMNFLDNEFSRMARSTSGSARDRSTEPNLRSNAEMLPESKETETEEIYQRRDEELGQRGTKQLRGGQQ